MTKRLVLKWNNAEFDTLAKSLVCFNCCSFGVTGFSKVVNVINQELCPCYIPPFKYSECETLNLAIQPAIFDFPDSGPFGWWGFCHKSLIKIGNDWKVCHTGGATFHLGALYSHNCLMYNLNDYIVLPCDYNKVKVCIETNVHVELCDTGLCEPCCGCCD